MERYTKEEKEKESIFLKKERVLVYFSENGREELVETLDRLLMAKKMLSNKNQHYPDKEKFWSGGRSSDVSKLDFFIETLEHSMNAKVNFDPEQKTKEGKYGGDMHSLQVQLDELDEFSELLQHLPNAETWKDELNTLIKTHLYEVQVDGFIETEMNVKFKNDEKLLHVEIEEVIYSTFHEFFDGFLKFEKDLNNLLVEMRQTKRRKGRKSA